MKASRLNRVRPMFTYRHDRRGDETGDDCKKGAVDVVLLT